MRSTHHPCARRSHQIQHVEMARDIAGTFNHKYKPLFTQPSAVVDDNVALLTGLDGRKMSKSYGNTIPLFGEYNPQVDPEKQLRKAIMQIVTNSQPLKSLKMLMIPVIFEIYKAFATPDELADLTFTV